MPKIQKGRKPKNQGGSMATRKTSKDDLMAEVLGVGQGKAKGSALQSPQGKAQDEARRDPGRPRKEPTIPFTLRLRLESAELLKRLVADLQGKALRGQLPRSEATIGTVVERGLALYAEKLKLK
jgi:hypothetical protein